MAQLELARPEAEAGALPPVCMRCGEAATTVTYQVFTRYPWLTSALAVLRIRYEPARCRIRVGTPLCAAHRNYWRWAEALWWLPFVLFLPVCLVELVALATAFNEDFGKPFLVAMGVNVVAWVAWLVWLGRRVIRPVRVDEARVVFRNVPESVVRKWAASERRGPTTTQPA